jgi:ribosome-associated protein
VDKLKRVIETSLDNDKAQDVVVIPLAGKSSLADYMVVASGTSQRHLLTLAEHLETKLKGLGLPLVSIEGKGSDGWVLLDAGDVIVHLFKPELRRHYGLEKMWGLDLQRAEMVP